MYVPHVVVPVKRSWFSAPSGFEPRFMRLVVSRFDHFKNARKNCCRSVISMDTTAGRSPVPRPCVEASK